MLREQVIGEYHELLAADAGLTPEFFAHLREQMRARRLVYGGRELGITLRPHFLTRAQYDLLARTSESIARAFVRVAEAALSDAVVLDVVGLTEAERRLALIHPGYAYPAVTTRLDAFIYGDQIKFVEYNAENPSSLTDQPGLNEVLFETHALQTLGERYRLRQFDPAESLRRALLSVYREWGGREAVPRVAILDWENLPTAGEFQLLRNYLAARGLPTVICAPDELEYSSGKLTARGLPIDLVYKRIIIHEFLSRYDERHPLVRAYTERAVCLVNAFRCKMLHKKAAFELLTDDEHAHWFTADEREAIQRAMPWTRVFAERRTTYHGETVDLVEFVRNNRARFVLKPNDDYGGHGIFFGDGLTEAEWDDCLSTALSTSYVVQEKLELRTEEFPVFDERRWRLEPMFVDVNPFLFLGKVEGALVRLSDSAVVNVTSGGGETGLFVIEDEGEA